MKAADERQQAQDDAKAAAWRKGEPQAKGEKSMPPIVYEKV